jgi:hypothetical protein
VHQVSRNPHCVIGAILTTNCNFSAFSGENKEKPLVFALAQIASSSVTAYALLLDIYQVFC